MQKFLMFFIIGGEDKKKEAAVAMECLCKILIFPSIKAGYTLFKAKLLKETINLEKLYINIGK